MKDVECWAGCWAAFLIVPDYRLVGLFDVTVRCSQ